MDNKRIFTARIKSYVGGRWGKGCEYTAIIIPNFFKNGNLIKTGFKILEYITEDKTQNKYGAVCTHSIVELIEEIKGDK